MLVEPPQTRRRRTYERCNPSSNAPCNTSMRKASYFNPVIRLKIPNKSLDNLLQYNNSCKVSF